MSNRLHIGGIAHFRVLTVIDGYCILYDDLTPADTLCV